MVGKRKGPFGGQRHKGQFGRGGKRAPSPTHDVMPTESQYGGGDDGMGMAPPAPTPIRGRSPTLSDYDNDGM